MKPIYKCRSCDATWKGDNPECHVCGNPTRVPFHKTSPSRTIRLAFQWRDDVDAGGMIESEGYDRKHFRIPDGDDQLHLASVMNDFYKGVGSPIRVAVSEGNLIPHFASELN